MNYCFIQLSGNRDTVIITVRFQRVEKIGKDKQHDSGGYTGYRINVFLELNAI